MQRGLRPLILGVSLLAACQSDPKTASPATDAPATATPALPSATAAGWSGQVDSLTAAQLPALEKLPGQLLEARRWTDAAGENVLVIHRTKPVIRTNSEDEMDEESVELLARQYVRQPDGHYRELWRLQDAVRDCPFDLALGPLPGATRVTDLDHDGQTETTLIYKLACRSDVSPAEMKLIMHEGKTKYALRGFMVVPDSLPATQRMPANACCLDSISKAALEADYQLQAGRYENEKDFRRAPRAFLGFARAQWRRWAPHDLDSDVD